MTPHSLYGLIVSSDDRLYHGQHFMDRPHRHSGPPPSPRRWSAPTSPSTSQPPSAPRSAQESTDGATMTSRSYGIGALFPASVRPSLLHLPAGGDTYPDAHVSGCGPRHLLRSVIPVACHPAGANAPKATGGEAGCQRGTRLVGPGPFLARALSIVAMARFPGLGSGAAAGYPEGARATQRQPFGILPDRPSGTLRRRSASLGTVTGALARFGRALTSPPTYPAT